MKNGFFLLMAMAALIGMVGCGSSDEGAGGSGTTSSGSATFSSFVESNASNVCFSTSTLGTAASCSVSGTPSSQLSQATCSVGTPSVVCKVGSISYSLAVAGSASADTACTNAGGSIQVTCPIATSGACTGASGIWTAATSPDVSDATKCAAAGGTFYTNLSHLTGSMPSASLAVGSNKISADPTEVATALGMAPSNLDNINLTMVAWSATASIDSYWEHSFYLTSLSVYNFGSNAVEFMATSPVATNNTVTIKTNSSSVYYHQ